LLINEVYGVKISANLARVDFLDNSTMRYLSSNRMFQ